MRKFSNVRVWSSATVDGGGVCGGADGVASLSFRFEVAVGLRGLTDAVVAFSNWKPRVSRAEITLALLWRGTRM